MGLIFVIIILVLLIGIYDFIYFLAFDKRLLNSFIDIVSIIIFPYLYLSFDSEINDCCGDSATFSPEHKLSILTIIVLTQIAVIVSVVKPSSISPIIEVIMNCILLIGLGLSVFLIFHLEPIYSILGLLQVMIAIINQLLSNHRRIIEESKELMEEQQGINLKLWRLMSSDPFIKFPLLVVICLPLLAFIICILLLFGQKPDSIVRAFTDTYKHGLSELDYMCNDVKCEMGHYLCTIAANGHADVVKPLRTGIRQGKTIVCNRQLLVSNAFEELIEEKFPGLHKFIRHQYNKVGKQLHQHYHVFNKQWVSDLVYVLMKPLEWLFVLTLYTFDKKPENRIALQYTQIEQRNQIKQHI